LCMFALLVVAGCASTKITNREQLVTGQLPRPAHVWVYDFAATPADVQVDSAMAGQYSQDTSQTAEQIATGRKLGAMIATELVKQIRDMGMPAKHAATVTTVKVNDIVIRGYLISFDEGSAAKRVTIGLGAGSSNLKVAVEGFQVTAQGLRKLGSGSTDAGANKTPGAAVGAATFIATANPAGLIISTGMKAYGEMSGKSKIEGRADQTAKEIADVLKERFQELGWI
jgi:hypothetical protein